MSSYASVVEHPKCLLLSLFLLFHNLVSLPLFGLHISIGLDIVILSRAILCCYCSMSSPNCCTEMHYGISHLSSDASRIEGVLGIVFWLSIFIQLFDLHIVMATSDLETVSNFLRSNLDRLKPVTECV